MHQLAANIFRPGEIPLRAEAKYRKVRLSNPTIARCIRDEEGAVDTLQMMGWVLEEDGEMLALPEGTAVTMKEVSSAVLAAMLGDGNTPSRTTAVPALHRLFCGCSHKL